MSPARSPHALVAALAAALLGVSGLVACLDGDTLPAVPPVGAPEAGTLPVADASPETTTDAGAIAYHACPGQFSGACAVIEVPLDWSKPDGKKLSLLVDKIATTSKSKAQLWLLQGGPGGSGSDMVTLARLIARARDDVDVFTLDHRGVGYSSRLGCPQEADVFSGDAGAGVDAGSPATQIAPCLEALEKEWGDDLRFFDTTSAARDLAYVIDRTKKPGQAVYVYGVSYGTYWAHRYLQIFPTHPAAVILDSILPPEGEYQWMFNQHGDTAGKKLAELCKKDAVCSDRLGPDPWTRLQSIVAKIGTGHCPDAGLTLQNRSILFQYLKSWGLNVYPFAALWRYERCLPEDAAALRTLLSNASLFNPPPGLFSPLLFYNIALSELEESPRPAPDTLDALYASAVFPAGDPRADLLPTDWPVYPRDGYVGKYAVTSVPILMMNGTLDVQTPIETALRMKAHFAAPNQHFVTIANANHGVVNASPTRAAGIGSPPGPPCGFSIMMSFLDSPGAAPDTSCLARLQPLDFEGEETANTQLFGTAAIWTGTPAPEPPRPARTPQPARPPAVR